MKKFLRKMVAVLTAVVISVSAAAISASAAEKSAKWELRRVVQSGYTPSDAQIDSFGVIFRTTSSMSGCATSCTSYSAGLASNGKPAYASVNAYDTDMYGYDAWTIGSYYKYSRITEKKEYSTRTVVYGRQIVVLYKNNYYLDNQILASSMSGYAYSKNGATSVSTSKNYQIHYEKK